ncbi:MAG TPA: hypothetical protein ENN47_00465 [Mesotoga infera]|uniref:CRISPR type III A-associated protein Csm2 n=1 Tax=Mesotoga infera TaxID=1236046 RepID=A0A7C1GYH6_9BACT|nr:hypothetical protein [Mesotoga infera]
MAEEYYQKNQFKPETDSQLRRFSEVARQASCIEEFENFMKYQIGRKPSQFRKGLIDEVEEVKKFAKEELLEAISHYFGYMARFAKFVKEGKGKE